MKEIMDNWNEYHLFCLFEELNDELATRDIIKENVEKKVDPANFKEYVGKTIKFLEDAIEKNKKSIKKFKYYAYIEHLESVKNVAKDYYNKNTPSEEDQKKTVSLVSFLIANNLVTGSASLSDLGFLVKFMISLGLWKATDWAVGWFMDKMKKGK